ncbi:GntR family transcriptional regulator [Maribacter sp. CXY002]|uniref:GntR family transcriptional regulator n=1 Tax=Maribacter luteocoastalis TaxID=3407671 RepID=UPI003B683632
MQSLVEQLEDVYIKLRKMIVTKKLLPGLQVSRPSLAVELQTSDNLLDLAIEKLANENLIIISPNKSVQVREISTVEMIEILDCRIALETKAVKLFTLTAAQDKIDDLRNLMVPFEKGPQSIHVFQKIDRHFHELIVNNCGNKTLKELFDKSNFWESMELIGITRSLNDVLQEHLDIISAIHHRNHNRAVLLMRRHLEYCKDSIL